MSTALPPAPYVGIDLAWSTRGRTGLAACDESGRLLHSGSVRSDEEIDAWLSVHAPDPVVVAIDAPLVVPDRTGQRAAERELARDYARFKASAHVANRSIPWLDPPRAEGLAARHGWSVDPSRRPTASRPAAIEVYPHAAMVGLFGLPERVRYKAKPGFDRPAGFRRLRALFESITELCLPESERWARLTAVIDDPGRGDLSRIEDEVDAILCAHLAWLWGRHPERLRVYGGHPGGHVVAPPPPPRP